MITQDKDFGELVFRQQMISAGVVLVRLAGLAPEAKAETIATIFQNHGSEMQDAFSVISPGAIRIRKRQQNHRNGGVASHPR